MSVAIVGSGVIGLSTAVELMFRGWRVTIYSRPAGQPLASEAACAIWLPFLTATGSQGAEDEGNQLVERLSIASWRRFEELSHADCGVAEVVLIEVFSEPQPAPFFSHYLPEFESVSLTEGLPEFPFAWKLRTFVIEMPRYLPWLRGVASDLGCRFVEREIFPEDLREIDERVVFNCSGLGARELAGDSTLMPVQGQLLLLDAMQVDAALGVDEFCVIPRSDALVIGSAILNNREDFAEDCEKTQSQLDQLTRWAESPLGRRIGIPRGISRRDVRAVVTGVRPVRKDGPRLEREELPKRAVYHNYGHGGSGVTLSWGCANEVVRLLEEETVQQACRINPDRPQTVSDLSIEVAHIDLRRILDPVSDLEKAAGESILTGRKIAEQTREHGCSASLVTMIDDKWATGSQQRRVLPKVLEFLASERVDYYCLESDLARALPSVLRIVSKRRRKKIEAYRQRHGVTGCSDDIVIWYCLRLGLLASGEGIVVPCSTLSPTRSPFVANRILSVLPDVPAIRRPEATASQVLTESFGAEIAAACSPIFL